MSLLSRFTLDEEPLWVDSEAVYPYSKQLERQLTTKSRFGDKISFCRKEGNTLRVARGLAPLGDCDHRVYGEKIEVKSFVSPRNSEQSRVMREMLYWLQEGESFIAECPTGFGKTIVTLHVMAMLGIKTLVVVSKEDLMGRWKAAIEEFTSLTRNQIGHVQASKYSIEASITLGMLHSVCIPGRYPPEFYKSFGLIVFDEVHRLGADTFSNAASLFPAALRVGLSATPVRSDGKELIFQAHIGPVRVKTASLPMTPKVLRYDSSWKCPRKYVDGELKPLNHSPTKCGHITKTLIRHQGRNDMIMALAMAAHGKGRNTVIFSDFLDHLDILMKGLISRGISSKDMAKYVGGMKEAELDYAKGKPLIFATYKMMGEGTDIPWLDACILGTPKSNVKQYVGRVLREYPDKKQPVVFDVSDLDSHVFRAYSKNRFKWFRSIGADIKMMSY